MQREDCGEKPAAAAMASVEWDSAMARATAEETAAAAAALEAATAASEKEAKDKHDAKKEEAEWSSAMDMFDGDDI